MTTHIVEEIFTEDPDGWFSEDDILELQRRQIADAGGPLRAIEALATQILARAKLPTAAGKQIEPVAAAQGHACDSPIGYAARAMDLVHRIARSTGDERIFAAIRLGALVNEAQMKFRWERAWTRGQQFKNGPKNQRRDALTRLIDDALSKLGKRANATAIWDHVSRNHAGAIEIDREDRTIWIGSRKKETTFKSFQNRVSERRKKLLP